MTLQPAQVETIIDGLLKHRRDNWDGSDYDFSISFGISSSVFNRLKKGERDRLIKHDKLITIGRKLNINFNNGPTWNIVQTHVFTYITEQLMYCKDNSIARIFCDLADVGKSTAAKQFMLTNKNVFYIDCSLNKTRTGFIKALGRAAGANVIGNFNETLKDVIYAIQSMDKPLIILDEAGDLSYEAWLEIKAIWNALEGCCGWYMMGADGLKKKIDNNMRGQRVGYAEIFRRFGSDYNSVMQKLNPEQRKTMFFAEASTVAGANLPAGQDCGKFISKQKVSSLTRLKEDIIKLKQTKK